MIALPPPPPPLRSTTDRLWQCPVQRQGNRFRAAFAGLKHRSENHLTKRSMTLSLGRTLCIMKSNRCLMTLSSVWLGNKYEIMQTRINISTIWKSHSHLGNEFTNPMVKTPHLITHFQFTFIHYSDSPNEPLLLSWTGVHFDLRCTKLQLGWTPLHSGRTNNKPQFHLGRTGCP